MVRSGGLISFPRGFLTAKVGSHTSYGFAPGRIFGESAALAWGDVPVDRPEVDTVVARRTDGRRRYIVLLNDSVRPIAASAAPDPAALTADQATAWKRVTLISPEGRGSGLPASARNWTVELPACGLAVLALDY